jgi:uncharacterized protein (DUF1697 family)
MATWIALLRGINVGGRHSLPMKDLVAAFESLRCQRVRTYIQSGNVTFQTRRQDRAALSRGLGEAVLAQRGFAPLVWLSTAEEWQRAIRNNPFSTEVGKALHFFFLESQPQKPDLAGLATLGSASESFELIDNVFYLHAPDGIGRSKLVAKLEKHIPVPMTARNWNTVAKLAEMVEQY